MSTLSGRVIHVVQHHIFYSKWTHVRCAAQLAMCDQFFAANEFVRLKQDEPHVSIFNRSHTISQRWRVECHPKEQENNNSNNNKIREKKANIYYTYGCKSKNNKLIRFWQPFAKFTDLTRYAWSLTIRSFALHSFTCFSFVFSWMRF